MVVTGKADAIRGFPLLSALSHAKVPLADSLIQALLAEHLHEQLQHKGRHSGNPTLREQAEEAQAAATKAIARQYRLVSLKLHPDQHGELYCQEFQSLQKAYDILQDAYCRCEYISSMLALVEKCDQSFCFPKQQKTILQQGHDAFVIWHNITKQEQNQWGRYQVAKHGNNIRRQPLALQATIFQQPPRAPELTYTSSKQPVIAVRLPPLYPVLEYRQLCHSVAIYGQSPNHTKNKDHHDCDDTVVLVKLTGEKLNKLMSNEDGWIHLPKITLPEFGIWQLHWVATLQDPNNTNNNKQQFVQTPPSAARQLDVEALATTSARSWLPALTLAAKQMRGTLAKFCQDNAHHCTTATTTTTNIEQLEHIYWQLHQHLAKSRSIAYELFRALQELHGYVTQQQALAEHPEFELLQTTMDHAACNLQTQLDDRLLWHQKKKSMKSFQHSVAAMIANANQQQTLAEWLLTVQPEQLHNTGGEVNRLYQILTQAKLHVDATSFRNAATRTDLFSDKQCRLLLEHASRIEAKHRQELEELEAKAIAEQQSKQSAVVATWTCSKCTVIHEGSNAAHFFCSCCGNAKSDTTVSATATATKARTKEQKQQQKQERMPVPTQQQPAKSGPTTTIPVNYATNTANKTTMPAKKMAPPPVARAATETTLASAPKWPISNDKVNNGIATNQPVTVTRSPSDMIPDTSNIDRKNAAMSKANKQPTLVGELRDESMTPRTVPESITTFSTDEEASNVTDAPACFAVATTTTTIAIMDSVLLFLCQQASCLKCLPQQFYQFLQSQDIGSLADLLEAANDDEFLVEMQEAGLKGFKKAAFKRAILEAAQDSRGQAGVEILDNGLCDTKPSATGSAAFDHAQWDLECPISFELMVKDPVMATDGFTYERHAIEGWFRRHQDDPTGIRSPKTNMLMPSLVLIPNIQIRAMAREASMRVQG